MTKKQEKFIEILEIMIANPEITVTEVYKRTRTTWWIYNSLALEAQKIIHKMKITNDNSKIAYYLRQLFKTPTYYPQRLSTHDKHQWQQAKEIFREMQNMNEDDKELKIGHNSWENEQLAKYGLHTDNIHVETDGTVSICEILKSKV